MQILVEEERVTEAKDLGIPELIDLLGKVAITGINYESKNKEVQIIDQNNPSTKWDVTVTPGNTTLCLARNKVTTKINLNAVSSISHLTNMRVIIIETKAGISFHLYYILGRA